MELSASQLRASVAATAVTLAISGPMTVPQQSGGLTGTYIVRVAAGRLAAAESAVQRAGGEVLRSLAGLNALTVRLTRAR